MGRWRADGNIEFLGRNDNQIKVRGFRIELGEIEALLRQHPQVNHTVVLAREDERGDKRLVAYVIPVELSVAKTSPSAESLRAYLKSALPDYMIPSAFVMLERFPLTSNGKLDRHALPAPERGAYASGDYEAPDAEIEKAVAEIWQEVLQVDRVSRRDNFFELGGHSLLCVRLMAKVQERFAIELSLHGVFQHPTVHEMSRLVESLLFEKRQAVPTRQSESLADIEEYIV